MQRWIQIRAHKTGLFKNLGFQVFKKKPEKPESPMQN
jgi:hypothetical protein